VKKVGFRSIALASVCAVAVIPVCANAQATEENEQSGGIEEIIVTANKRDENLQNVPISITAFSQDQLDKRGATGLEGIQESTPNLNFSLQSAGQNVARVTLRGIGTETLVGAGDPGIALHIDGVYVGRNSAAAGDIFDMERVEVLRGPQGTLYGRNATGGSVNFITKKPTDQVEGSAEVTYGNYDTIRARGVVNVPLSDTLSARINLSTDSHSGYIENLFTGGRDNADKDTQAGRFQLRWEPKDGQDFLLRAYFQKSGGAGPGSRYLGTDIVSANGYPTNGYVGNRTNGARATANVYSLGVTATGQPVAPRPTGFYEVSKNAPEFLDTLIKGVDFEANLDVSDSIALKSLTSYQTNHNEILVDADNSELSIETRNRDSNAKQFSQEFNLISQSDSSFKWIVGAYYYREELSEFFRSLIPRGTLPSTFIPAPTAAAGGGGILQERLTFNTTNSYALFGQATYDLTDRLSVTLGVRHTWDSKDQKRSGGGQVDLTNGARALAGGALGQEAPTTGSASFSELTYRASVSYQITPDNLLFGSYSRGYKSGGFDFNGGRLTTTGEQIPYNPEFVDAFEFGSKNKFFDRRVLLNLTGFYYKYKDLQVFRLTDAGPLTDNAAQSTIWGIEGELKIEPSDVFSFDASFGYLNAKYDSYTIALPPTDFSGNRLNYAPKWTVAAGVDYTIPIKDNKLVARLDWSYRSDTFFDRANTALDTQKAYSLFNARLRYDTKTWFFDLWGKNITGTKYVTGQLINPAFQCNCRTVNLGAPTTYGVTAGVRF
jgi:iron complex outermembrane recepter protein